MGGGDFPKHRPDIHAAILLLLDVTIPSASAMTAKA
jgi:hypothetical protein